MTTAFFLKKLIASFLLPPLSPMLVIALGLLLLNRRPRLGRSLSWGGLALLYLLSTRMVADQIIASVEYWPPLDIRQAKKAQAIVVLSGDAYPSAPEYGGDTVKGMTLERIRYAASVARQSGLPVLTSGGGPPGYKTDAEAMRDALVRDFAVRVRWLETESADTRDNARMSAAILKPLGLDRIILVTHAYHMRRSIEEFERAGFEVVPAPTGYRAQWRSAFTFQLLPDPDGIEHSRLALHELLGRLALRLRG